MKYQIAALLACSSLNALAETPSPALEVEPGPPSILFRVQNRAYPTLKINGNLQLDQIFALKHQNTHFINGSGANYRNGELNFSYQFSPLWHAALNIGFVTDGISLGDVVLSYEPESTWLLNLGQFGPSFSLDNSNDGKWIPFLEHSLPVLAFSPSNGVGAQVKWRHRLGAISLSVVQPQTAAVNQNELSLTPGRFNGAFRLTLAPVQSSHKTLHLGLSSYYQRDYPNGVDPSRAPALLMFDASPELSHRNIGPMVSTSSIRSTHYQSHALEAGLRSGPWLLQGELFQTRVARFRQSNLSFHGSQGSVSYLLTGGSHSYSVKDGNFGPGQLAEAGSLELAARLSRLVFNDSSLDARKAQDLTLALSYTVNPGIRIMANYVRAMPTVANQKQRLHFIGTRLQVLW